MMKCNDAFASKIFWRGLMTINLRLRGRLDQTLPGVSGVWNDKSKIKVPLLQTSALEEHLLLYPELFHRLYRWEVDLPESMGLSMTPSLSSLCSPGHGSALEDLLWHPSLVLLVRDAEVLVTLRKIPFPVSTKNSISDSPATGSCPCPRHGGSSSWPEILTRYLLLLLAFCENLWRLRSVLKSILCGRRRSSLMFPCTTVFTISQRSPLSLAKFLFIWK